MPYAFDTYSGNGSLTDFNISFPYINEDHVKVYVNYTQTSFTFEPNKSTARLASAPASGAVVEVRRITPLANVLVDYADGSTLTAGDLDTNNLQHLYIEQELEDIQQKAIAISATTGLPTANSRKITNVADPTDAQDAATKNYSDTTKQPLDAELTELATMSSGTASSLADLTNTEVQILDGATVTTAELNKLDGVTATTAEINYVDGVTSNVQTQLNAKQPLDAELTELATMASDTASSLADLTAAEVQALDGVTASTAELNILDGVTSTTAEINKLDGVTAKFSELNILDGVTATTAEINLLDGVTATTAELNYVDGVTSNVQTQLDAKQPLDSELTTLAGMQGGTASILASGTALGATTSEINSVCENRASQTTITDDDAKIPTSGAVVDYVAAQIAPLGGLEVVATEVAFPNTQPASGVVISISDAGGVVINGSGVSTTGRTVGGTTVTINGFPSSLHSETLAAGVGLMVSSTGSSQTYNYHKILGKEDDIKQLSDDINDFNARYRVGSSNPSSALDAGDLFFNTTTNKLLIYNATNTAWEESQSIGNFFISTFSESFDGSRTDFTLSNAPDNAQQVILSINGVIQKPNAGTSTPSEGFALTGSTIKLSNAPASGDSYFAYVLGSTVNIGTPSNNTVSTAIIQNGAVTGEKIATNLDLADDKKIRFGTGNDLKIHHNGTSSYIVNDTGNLHIQNSGTNNIKIQPKPDEEGIVATANGAVSLYYDDSIRLQTYANGTTLIGDLYLDNGTNAGKDILWDQSANYFKFTDNVKAVFGSGVDLEIYHDGSNSIITAGNAGDLQLISTFDDVDIKAADNIFLRPQSGEDGLKVYGDGTVSLYWDGSKKIETIATGATVTGVLNVTGGELFLGTADSSSGHINAYENMTFNIDTDNDDTNRTFKFLYNGASGSGTTALEINESGNVDVYGQLKAYSTGNAHIVAERASGASGWIQAQTSKLVFGSTTNHQLDLITNSGTRLEVNTSGDVKVNSGDITFGTAGKGIVLGTTSNTDANTLDDYEEGEYTPTVTCHTSGSYNLESDENTLAYTKIGRVVHVQGRLEVGSESSPDGKLRFSLPFAAADLTDKSDNAAFKVLVINSGGWGNYGLYLQTGVVGGGNSYFQILKLNASGTDSYIEHGDVDTAWQIYISGTYFVA